MIIWRMLLRSNVDILQSGGLVGWRVLLAHGHGHHHLPTHLRPHSVQDEDMGELRVLGQETCRVRHLRLGYRCG